MKLSFRNGVALSSVRQACRARWTWYWGWTGLYASTHSRGTSRFLRWAKTQPLWQTVHLFWTSTHEYKWYAHCSLKTEKQFDLNPNQTSKRAMALMIFMSFGEIYKARNMLTRTQSSQIARDTTHCGKCLFKSLPLSTKATLWLPIVQ